MHFVRPFLRVSGRNSLRSALVFLLWACLSSADCWAADWQFHIQFDKAVHAEAYTGRVYMAFLENISRGKPEPRIGPEDWFHPGQFLALDVADWAPGETLTVSSSDPALLAFPRPLKEMTLDGYHAQAIVRFNPLDRNVGTGAGNGISQVVQLDADNAAGDTPVFKVDRLIAAREFQETRWGRLLRVRSKLLSDFHGRDVYLQAAVILPASYYEEPERRYPAMFTVPGFGGTHMIGKLNDPIPEQNERGVEFLRIILDPSCPLGHHVFADSANNGPVGQALIKELIPEFDRQYRSVSAASARFVTGHSSGGWSSLWLQVTYPDVFGGVWSTAPDPVDFRDFQRINLYRSGENMYVTPDGEERPLARRGSTVVLKYREFAEMEWVQGFGGQLHSFEAVFSPRGDDGKPLLVWDRQTGVVDTEVANTWERYDIRLILERNWQDLGPKLAGKLHVFMGDEDTFYLEGAAKLLKKSLETLGSDAVVEIHPGRDHGSLMTSELRSRIRSEMVSEFLKHHGDDWQDLE